MLKRFLPYLLLFLLSLAPRFVSLGTVPTSLSHDEVDLIIQAHSVKLTGRDLSGSWSPLSLLPNEATMAELGPVINLPALSLLPNSLFSAHVTTAILGSFYPLLIVLLLFSWGVSKQVAWLSGFMLALSPWHLLFSRTTLEQPTSLFFYTLSWLFLSKIFNKNNNLKVLLLSIFSFIIFYSLGFYTYHGYKFALPLLTTVVVTFNYLRSVNPKRKLLFLIIMGTIASLYLRTYFHQSSYIGRQSEIVYLDQPIFAKKVDHDRALSILPDKLNQLFVNKPFAMLRLATSKYLETISPVQLFLTGEQNGVFATGRTGYLYVFLLPFVLIGISKLLTSGKYEERAILILLLISPLATVLHKNGSFAFRSAIFIVILTITSVMGIEYLNKRFPKLRLTLVAISLTIVSFIHFCYVYFGYYPVESSRSYFFADRTLATYLSHRNDEKILVIDPQPRYIMSYLVLTKEYISLDSITALVGHYSPSEEKNIIMLNNLTIRRDCPDTEEIYDTVIIDSSLVGSLDKCKSLNSLNKPVTIRQIVDPLDNGGKKVIYNDSICSDTKLMRYVRPKTLEYFALDKMSRVQFCSSWIIEN